MKTGWNPQPPGLRRHSGSETAAAIQRYAYLEIRRFAVQQGLELTLENFQDEAWIMLRFNQWNRTWKKAWREALLNSFPEISIC